MRLKYRITEVNLRKWFPADDEIATEMARLCILKEDFLCDFFGLVEESLPALDKLDKDYRKIYFLRNMIKTLSEIRGVIETLAKKPEFKKLLVEEARIAETFDDLKERLKIAFNLFKDIRNEICGHILSSATHDTLREMDPNRRGIIQIGSSFADSRFKFASELLTAILFRNVSPAKQQERANEIFSHITEITGAINALDALFIHYILSRRLM